VEYATLIDQVDRRSHHEGDRRSHTVNLVNSERREFPSRQNKECWNCGRTGHLSRECTRKRPNDEQGREKAAFNFAMSVGTGPEHITDGNCIEWILDSGSSMHYTKHLWALTDLRDEFHVGQTANDSKLVTEQVGNIQVRIMGGHEATILSVNYSPSMPVNLLSLGWLYKRGYVLKESDQGNFIIHKESGTRMFKVYIEGGVFKVRTPVIKNQVFTTSKSNNRGRTSEDEVEGENAGARRGPAVVHVGSLWHFHKGFGYLNYDKIIKMAKKPESGIKLLDQDRKYCVTCAEGK
jgi:hypothetical protein